MYFLESITHFLSVPLPGMPVLTPVRVTIYYIIQSRTLLKVKVYYLYLCQDKGTNQFCSEETKAHYHLLQLPPFVLSLPLFATSFQIFLKKFHSLFHLTHIGGPFVDPAQLCLMGCLGLLVSSFLLEHGLLQVRDKVKVLGA